MPVASLSQIERLILDLFTKYENLLKNDPDIKTMAAFITKYFKRPQDQNFKYSCIYHGCFTLLDSQLEYKPASNKFDQLKQFGERRKNGRDKSCGVVSFKGHIYLNHDGLLYEEKR